MRSTVANILRTAARCGLVLALSFTASGAYAATFKVIHSFTSASLGYPQTGVAPNSTGTAIYGTLQGASGGPGKSCSKNCGGIFDRTSSGTKLAFKFDHTDGGSPTTPVLVTTNSIYGTTLSGGTSKKCGVFGCGVIFELAADGTETVLYSFCHLAYCTDGTEPSGVIADGSGNLYGEASLKGPNKEGVVFEFSQGGSYSVLYAFCPMTNCPDGAEPSGGLLLDSAGNLYGTTMLGGTGSGCGTNRTPGCGTVFKLAADGTFSVLYNFCSKLYCKDGSLPEAGLIADTAGNLYGTTASGGNGLCTLGCGTVFKLAPDGTETVLHAFQAGNDGETPLGGLAVDGTGNLYGTTQAGGGNFDSNVCAATPDASCGTVFEVDASGKESILFAFCPVSGCTEGAVPGHVTPVLVGDDLYGTTIDGGIAPDIYGTLWKITL